MTCKSQVYHWEGAWAPKGFVGALEAVLPVAAWPMATRAPSTRLLGLIVMDDSPQALDVGSPAGADEHPHSALADALTAVGDRWTLLVIATLLDGPRRFGELQEAVSGIAPNVLSQRLRHLEHNALIVARAYSERPPRFVYELSATGQELAGVLRLLEGWATRNTGGSSVPRHAVCGTPIEARWWCPTCEQAVDEADGEDLHFA